MASAAENVVRVQWPDAVAVLDEEGWCVWATDWWEDGSGSRWCIIGCGYTEHEAWDYAARCYFWMTH